jgi:hypothetical protein
MRPRADMNGRCETGDIPGCRFWMMIADNRAIGVTPDIVGFLILDGKGNRALVWHRAPRRRH